VQGKSSFLETLEEVVLLALERRDMEDRQRERLKSSHPGDLDDGKLLSPSSSVHPRLFLMAHLFSLNNSVLRSFLVEHFSCCLITIK
jgi:hypothetical protein